VSWKSTVREEWAKLPSSVREEVYRRERHVEHTLQQTAEERKFASTIAKTLAPYEAALRAEGEPIAVIGQFAQIVHTLQTGSAAAKARLVANLVKGYDVDVDHLDRGLQEVLGGKKPEDLALARQIEERISPLQQKLAKYEEMERQTAARQAEEQERAVEAARTELQAFRTAPENKYFDTVVGNVQLLIEAATNRGQEMSLQEAYRTACMMDPAIVKAIATENVQKSRAATTAQLEAKKKAAAASPRSSAPAAGAQAFTAAPDNEDLGSTLGRLWDSYTGR
jgi:hypothetical protein